MMVGSSFARRIRVIALLLCVYAVCACIFSPVHAASTLLESGTSGTCTWKYEQVDGDTVLTIAPTEGTEGTLGSFSWGGSSHKGTTKRVVVRGTVKVESSAKKMFKDFRQATSIDVAGLDVAGVTDMQDMFSGCSALESLDLSGWDTSTTVNMKNMFKGTRSLKKITLGNKFHIEGNAKFEDAGLNVGVHWVRETDGTAANSGDTIFYDVNKLIASHNQESGDDPKRYVRQAASKGKSGTCAWEYIPLKDQQGNPIKDADGKNTYKLSIRPQDGHNSGTLEDWGDEDRGVGVPPWRLPSCDEYREQTTELEIKEGGEENKQPVKAARSCYNMFAHFTKLKKTDISGLDVSSTENMQGVFHRCSSLTSLDVSKWNTSSMKNAQGIFHGCSALTKIFGLGQWETSQVKNMMYMFCECFALTSPLDVSRWNVSQVTNMEMMFFQCHALTSLDVSGWVTSEVTTMSKMFSRCIYLTSLDVSRWNVSQVTNMEEMFSYCYTLDSLDLGGWNVSRVTSMKEMFSVSYSLTSLDLSGWDTSGERTTDSGSVSVDMTDMFKLTHFLKDITLGKNFHISNDAMFEDAGSWSGSRWAWVGEGTVDEPEKPFDTAAELIEFHNGKSGDGSEHYIRQAITKGMSGTCMWEYLSLDVEDAEGKDTYKLSIHPLSSQYLGTLEDWKEGDPPWRHTLCDEYRKQTTELEIKDSAMKDGQKVSRSVEARTCRKMFADFQKLKKADVSGLDVAGETNMQDMFRGTPSLKDITLRVPFRIKDDAKFEDAGSNVGTHWVQVGAGNNVENPKGRVFDTPDDLREFHDGKTGSGSERYVRHAVTKGESGDCMWEYIPLKDEQGNPIKDAEGKDTYKLSIHPLPGKGSGTLEDWGEGVPPWRLFPCDEYRKQTTELEIKEGERENKQPVKALTCCNMFADFQNLQKADVSGLDVSSSKNMEKMFYGCTSLKSLNLEEWKVSSMENARSIFHFCSALTEIGDVSKWNTQKTTDMFCMFAGCNALTSLNLSGWDTSNVANMNYVFWDCDALTKLDLSGWDTSGVGNTKDESMIGMFKYTYSLKKIILGDRFKFKFENDPVETGFQDAGSWAGSRWLRVGSEDQLDAAGLIEFQNGKEDNSGPGHYVRLAITKGISDGCMWEYIPLKDQQGNPIRDAEEKDTYRLSIHPLPKKNLEVFEDWDDSETPEEWEDSGTLEDWEEGDPPWRNSLCEEYRKQTTELEIKDSAMEDEREVKKTVKALTCRNMFADFQKLQKADVSGLDVADVTNMQDMFRGTHSLKDITLGVPFHIKDDTNNDAKFEDAGSNVGSHWVRVADGTVENPKGQVFASAKELIGFHQKRTKEQTDTERYIRVSEYTINFHKNAPAGVEPGNIEGTMEPQKIKYGDKVPLNENKFTLTGHSFLGWSTQPGKPEAGKLLEDKAIVKDLATGLPANKVNLYAQWGKHGETYTIIFNKNAPEGFKSEDVKGDMPQQTMTYGTAAALNGNKFVLDNHVFLGWGTTEGKSKGGKLLADKEVVTDLATGLPVKEVNLYAQWGKLEDNYTIIFNKNAPEGVDPTAVKGDMPNQTMTYGTAAALNGNKFVLDNHVFLGWGTTEGKSKGGKLLADKEVVIDLATGLPANKVNLYAQWGEHGKAYTIIFNKNAPEGVDPEAVKGAMQNQEMEYGTAAALNENKFTLDGYLFLGWSTQPGKPEAGKFLEDKAIVKDLATGLPVKEVNLYARWGEIPRVTYIATEGGSVSPTSEMLEEGVDPQGSTAIPDEGYHFVKWTSDKKPDWSFAKAVLGKEEVEAVAKEDGKFSSVTFTAHFEADALPREDTYTVTFDKNDIDAEGTMSDETFTCNVAKKLPACTFTKEGHKFSGWNTEADGSGTSFEDEAEMNLSTATSIILYAQWENAVTGEVKEPIPTDQLPELRSDPGQEPSYPSGWYQDDNRVFYYRNRRKLTGWHELGGTIQEPWSLKKNWFYFDKKGIMLTGRHKLVGGFKNAQGVQKEHWFGLDEKTGAQIRGWQKAGNGSSEKWYYYRPEDGTGLVGRHQIVGGFKNAHGVRELNWFYFNKVTGAQIRGWHKITEDGTENWYYYRDGDGIMLKGQHRLTGGFKNQQGVHEMNWFYFDDITGIELRNCWKDISSQNKTCYYGSDGAMYKGWRVIDGRWYYFDDATGARH